MAPSIACSVASAVAPSEDKLGQANQVLHTQLPLPRTNSERSAKTNGQRLTIEHAIHAYLQTHRKADHCPKTLEWHQTALRQFQQYLFAECHLLYVSQITQTNIHDWIAFLYQPPTTRGGSPRAASTIETYARSVRAFCAWLVHRGDLRCSPMSEEVFPRVSVPLPPFVQPEAFEQLVNGGLFSAAHGPKAQRISARNRALLWILFETGITVSELCALRLGDVDRKMRILRVRGKGGKERRVALGSAGLEHLLSYLDQSHRQGRENRDDPLFHSENGRPLTKNSLTLVFARLRKRAESSDTSITPQTLRHSFAFRYLQTGGDPHGLQLLLGYEGMAPVRQYLRWYEKLVHGLPGEGG